MIDRVCELVHIDSAICLIISCCWGFKGPSLRRRRDAIFRARRRIFLGRPNREKAAAVVEGSDGLYSIGVTKQQVTCKMRRTD